MMHDKLSSSVPEVSVSGALIHPSIAQVFCLGCIRVWVWVYVCVCVCVRVRVCMCVFSFGIFALKSGHQTRLVPGESTI